jgi:SAM-dependent methyltransferase
VLDVGAGDLAGRLAGASIQWVAPMIGLTLAWLFIRFIRWQFLLRRAGVRIPIRPSLWVYLAGLPGTATPGYVGELVRGVFVRRRFGAPFIASTAVLVLERLLDIAALAVVTILVSGDTRSMQIGALFLAGAPVVAILLAPLAKRAGLSAAAVSGLRARGTIVPALALSLLAWGPACLLFATGARALDLELGIAAGAGIFSKSTLLGALTLLPAGFGATGSIAILALGDLGIPLASAVALVSLVRLTSTGVALAGGTVFLWRELLSHNRQSVPEGAAHFDDIAAEYHAQWSPHVWNLLLQRKLDLMVAELPPPGEAPIGLDLGCGLGLQVAAMSERGYRVVGMDPSWGLLAVGRARGHSLIAGDALRLPFADGSLDFAYCIGVLHHLPGRDAQARAYAEIARVLKPGGVFLIHESNPRNPLFRFYMGYIFPILRSIDEGTEWWITSEQPGAGSVFTRERVRYFTWLPDFTPQAFMSLALSLERLLERGPFHRYSAHYMAVLRKGR